MCAVADARHPLSLQSSIQGTVSEAQKALASNGLDLNSVQNAARPAKDAAQQAVDQATPFVYRVFDFVTHADPANLAQYSLAAIGTYLLVRCPRLCRLSPAVRKPQLESLCQHAR